jgi:hypothetical protein
MDYALESTFDVKFTSRIFATGVPGTLAGSPVVEIYEDNGTTQITGAETLTVDFDSVTGLNNLRIVATAANGFEAGKSYSAVISVGTVSSVSVVGEVVCNFSIQRQPVNWANVTAPTTAVDLSGTDIQLCDTVTTNTDVRGTDSAALASVCTEVRLATLTDWIDGGRLDLLLDAIPTTAMRGTDNAALASVCTETRLAALTDWLNGGRLDLILDIIAADTTTDIPALIATAQADLDLITGSDGATLATAQGNYAPAKVADILTTALTEAYAADGAAPTLTQAVMLILQHLSESSISETTKTVKKLDGSTSAATFTLDDATTPTSITRAT